MQYKNTCKYCVYNLIASKDKIYREVIRMFKVKKEEYVNKTFRMPVELVKKLEVLAQSEKVSVNNLVTQCCRYALENREKTEK